MRDIAPAALAAIEAGEAVVGGAVEIIGASGPFRVWSGYGEIVLDGQTYAGIGHHGLIQATGGALGGAASAITLTLSGVDVKVLELVEPGEVRDAPVTIRRLIFNGAGSVLLDASVYARGRADTLTREETPGGTATISVNVETAARGLGRRSARMRTDVDQRLITGTDGGFKHVSYAGQKTLYWGGQRPAAAGQGLPNVTAAGSGALDRLTRSL